MDMTLLHYEIPDELHRRVKSNAALKGQTIKAFLIEVLERAVEEPDDKR